MAISKKVWLGAGGGMLLIGAALALFVFEVQTAFYDARVDEKFELTPDMLLLASGEFHKVAHAGKGKASVYRSGDSLSLRLTDFAVDNGPSLHLRVVDLADATDNEAVKSAPYVDLGPMRGNVGNQTYALPKGFDPTARRAVVVWCDRFSVNFVTAPLAAPQ